MDKNNSNTTNRFGQPNQTQRDNPAIRHESVDPHEIGQNKYPSFDIGGDNFTKTSPTPNQNLSPSFETQENLNKSSSPIQNISDSPDTSGQIISGTPTSQTAHIETSAVSPAFTKPSDVKGIAPQGASGSPPYTFATLTKRSYATFIDGLIVGLITLPFSLPEIITQFKTTMATSMDYSLQQINGASKTLQTQSPTNLLYTVLSLVGSLIGILYSIYFIGKKGATPGKRLMKIKVVNKETNEPPGMLKAFLREIVGKFASSIFFFLGYFWAIWDKEKQAWHDKIAGTIVIKT